MGKINLPYLQCSSAKGRSYYRYRRDGQLIRITETAGSPEFLQRYQEIHASFETLNASSSDIVVPGSIKELIAKFKKSAEFGNLAPATAKDYRLHMDAVMMLWGRFQVRSITRNAIMALRDSLKDKPATANYRIAVIRRLLSFAIDRGYISTNPASNPKKLKTGTWHPWTEAELATFHDAVKANAISQSIVTAVMLALYTGQRESDILRKSWADIRKTDNTIAVTQKKTGKRLLIPLHSKLRNYLDTIKVEDRGLLLVRAPNGGPFLANYFRHMLRNELIAIGLPKCVFHGLRKNAVNSLLEAGCSTAEAAAITGQTMQMVEHYAQNVNQSHLAKAAIIKLEKASKKPR